MSVTVADLLAEETLQLSCVVGHEWTGRPIRWVHVSEIGDPSPWLSGNELLLTTGLIERSEADVLALFESLAGRGIAAVGYGVGFVSDEVPQMWAEAARTCGIPLLAVPLSTPYIAIAEFVSRRIAAEELTQVNRMLDVQQRLARNTQTAALVHDSLVKVARVLEATVVLRRADGSEDVVQGGGDLDEQELNSIRNEIRIHGDSERQSATAGVRDLVIYTSRAASSFLAVARKRRYSAVEQNIIGSVATVLREDSESLSPLTVRQELAELILDDVVPPEDALMRILLPRSRGCLVVQIECECSDGSLDEAASQLCSTYSAQRIEGLVLRRAPGIVAVMSDAAIGSLEPIVTRVIQQAIGSDARWRAGISGEHSLSDLRNCVHEASAARRMVPRDSDGPRVVAYASVSADNLAGWIAEQAAEQPLMAEWRHRLEAADGDSQRLSGSLRAFLRCNGARERAAASIGIHRQTVNARLTEAEQILDVSLESPSDRVLLWLALESGDRGMM
ncbi:PucR family transcriptional regulator [Paramicrobacterium chengjingii]|uniref:PucR family transcriptional regulator ligand-binding domain-containing protein n=1 Tax=Paramicrobacterium chengjingii TaxID=2769067 RepID=A0ABX6YKI5_9MICO|nr:PucR family transcriptional regulator ligand-binding domain-containing protein [Microbacterium chengjingii]QPZ39323.1 PucR family transcriptional regulator ligand-binding domain-containing protein [Microbacterium chengjingii]